MRKAWIGAGTLLLVSLALFLFLRKKPAEPLETRAGPAASAVSEEPAGTHEAKPSAPPSQTTASPSQTQAQADEDAAANAEAENAPMIKPHEEMQNIERLTSAGNFSFRDLNRILRSAYPKDVKMMALQAYNQTHHVSRDDAYAHTDAILGMIRNNLNELREQDLPVVNETLEILNDAANPQKKAVDDFLRATFDGLRGTDSKKASMLLNAMSDADFVKGVAENAGDPLQMIARNRLPHIAPAGLLREIINSDVYNLDQKLSGMGQLAQKAETGGDSLSLKQTLEEARRLDQKHGSGSRFYEQALNGASLADFPGKDAFFGNLIQDGLKTHRGLPAKGGPRFSEVPELMATFGYLTSVQPDESTVYSFVSEELQKQTASKPCKRDRADQLLFDFVSFWAMSCEHSPDCQAKARGQASYLKIMGEAKKAKAHCDQRP